MAIIVLQKTLTKKDIKNAREDYPNYIKITADLLQEIVAIGGEYHADAEKVLLENHGSKQKDIWGGGYNIDLGVFETNAVINIRQPDNPSSEIIDSFARENFLKLVKIHLGNIKSLL
jgi:hypothetical protein